MELVELRILLLDKRPGLVDIRGEKASKVRRFVFHEGTVTRTRSMASLPSHKGADEEVCIARARLSQYDNRIQRVGYQNVDKMVLVPGEVNSTWREPQEAEAETESMA